MQTAFWLIKLLLLVAAVLAFSLLPRSFQNNIYFGLRLTQKQRSSKTITNIIFLYQVSTAISGGILIIVYLFLQAYLDQALSDLAFILIICVVIAFAVICYVAAAKAVTHYVGRERHEQEAPNNAGSQYGGLLDTSFTEGQLCPSLWWYLLHCALIAACMLTLAVTYDSISPYISLWVDFSGTAVWTAPKSPQTLALPIIVQVLVTLICFAVSSKIKAAPLYLKGIDAQAELDRSRKRRALWSAYVCILAFFADLVLYAYMHFMFLMPQYKAYVPVLIYAALVLLLALTLLLAYITREK